MDKIKYDKPRLSIEKHITSLQQKGLLIKNVAYAQHILQNVSYYRLSGYFHHFYDMNNPNKFIKNISFEHIIELYDFDKRLRLLILEAIEHIEISWRTIIADVISKKDIFAFNSMDIYHHKDTTYTQFQTMEQDMIA